MKQCPRCSRNYDDDALSYCLEDGTALVKKYDANATLISPYPPTPFVPPTVAYERTPHTTPVQPPVFVPGPAPSRNKSPWLVGILVVMALTIGLAIGGFIFQRSNSSASSSPSIAPSKDPVATQTTTASTETVAASPEQAQPATTTATPKSEQAATVQDQQCVLYNDKSDKSVIRVRVNCDTQNCDNDASTIAGEYPDNTPIRVISGASVQGSRFTWAKVVLVSSGQTVWVASTKIKCS